MARLNIRLLGPFQVALDSQPVTTFESDKVRALLAFLTVEADRPHRRESLAGLLWPEFSDTSARVNLRGALANLRQVIGDHRAEPPFLHISRQAIQFNPTCDAWVDVQAFVQSLQHPPARNDVTDSLEAAVALYRGSFLEGFSLPDSPVFEEWALLNRERFHRLALEALGRLASDYEQRRAYDVALRHARHMLDLDPLLESAHRQVMRLLVCSGERGEAIAQYRTCRRILRQELDVAPSPETQRLFEQINSGEWNNPVPRPDASRERPLQPPLFLREPNTTEAGSPDPATSGYAHRFVARERELAWLEGHLEGALAGQGRVAFVVGGPGRGKTVLLQAFARRAMAAHAELLVASGNGNAYSGVGDPYLPFREVLDMLSGDVEARWSARAIDRDHALRLWGALPLTAQALVESGPDLIDTLLPGRPLLTRVVAHTAAIAIPGGWRSQLEELVVRKATLPPDPNLQQSAVFRQYSRVLGALARRHPLLLLLDDLQWIDTGSAGLLFHLGRALPGRRILVVGAYRPEELALGRPGMGSGERERHPLEGVMAEFRRRYGDVWLDLGRTAARQGRRFIELLLDSEPNRLGEDFRDQLYRRTEGHPLFTTELLHTMQERGDLVREAKTGAWVQGGPVDWEALPPRVEGAIAARINRLEGSLRELLGVASVEGEEFTAQVIARVQGVEERWVIRQLSGPLEGQHRLVRAQGVRRLGEQWLSRHHFRHNLFQAYLYSSLNGAERAYLHRDVGEALEGLYAGHAEELAAIAPQLARHFQEAGIPEKGIEYLRQAGERATRMSAHEEAVAHFSRALELLETLPDSPGRSATELALQLSLAVPLLSARGWVTQEMASLVARTRELCEQVGEAPQRFAALWFAYTYHAVSEDLPLSLALAEQLHELAERSQDRGLTMLAHYGLASILCILGEFEPALAHAQRVFELYDPREDHNLTFKIIGHNPLAQSLEVAAMSLWALGYPDRARERTRQVLHLAEELAHPYTLALAHTFAGIVLSNCRNWAAAQASEERALSVSREHGLLITQGMATINRGMARAKQGRTAEAIPRMQQSAAELETIGTRGYWDYHLTCLAEASIAAGEIDDALQTLARASDWEARARTRYWEAEIHRLTGELLQRARKEVEAEAHFRRAIEVAQAQRAKSLELRAVMSLARLWRSQGQGEKVCAMLAEIYGWFTEGFDTGDLREARALLEALR